MNRSWILINNMQLSENIECLYFAYDIKLNSYMKTIQDYRLNILI